MQKKITILRDTAADRSLLRQGLMNFPISIWVGQGLILGMECQPISVPLRKVQLEAGSLQGQLIIGTRPSLPFKDVDLLLFRQ